MQTVNCNIHNRFDVEVIDAKSGEIRQRAQAENIILDALWTKLLSTSPAYNQYIHYGTGSGTPAANRTQLFTFLGSKAPATADDYYDINYTAGTLSVRRKIVLSESEHVGATLTEVGIAYGASAANLVTHAMLKDMNGNTVTILKTATDIINIYATVFVHVNPNGYANGKIKVPLKQNNQFIRYFLTGTSYSTVPGMISSVAATSGAECDVPLYDKLGSKKTFVRKTVSKSVDVQNKSITLTASRISSTEGNDARGFKTILFETESVGSNYPICAIVVDASELYPAGTIVTGEPIGTGDGTTKDFTTKFPFASSAKIYVDGVQTQATVDKLPSSSNFGVYLELVPEKSSKIVDVKKPLFAIPSALVCSGNSNGSFEKSTYAVYYNPYYQAGIRSISIKMCTIYASDDGETWAKIAESTSEYNVSTVTVPAEHRNKKYWKISVGGTYDTTSYYACYDVIADTLTGKNIHFATPPASGAVITADYTTETIAKDENHVFDCSITIQLGELVV